MYSLLFFIFFLPLDDGRDDWDRAVRLQVVALLVFHTQKSPLGPAEGFAGNQDETGALESLVFSARSDAVKSHDPDESQDEVRDTHVPVEARRVHNLGPQVLFLVILEMSAETKIHVDVPAVRVERGDTVGKDKPVPNVVMLILCVP